MKNRNHFIKGIICLLFIACITKSFGAMTVTLTGSNHNGYSVSCINGTDGSITSSVSNGTAPYTYRWSTGATTANISSLPAGLYQVTVTDASTATAVAQITLTQPRELNVVLTPSIYGGEYNISCYNCCNGYINSTVSDGVSPYTYLWGTSATTANISSLCEGTYLVTVTDHNGCTKGVVRTMLQPDRDDWQMTGNTGSTPGTNFIGTSDSIDLVFKTKNVERLRFKANGGIKLPGFGSNTGSYASLYVDSLGNLKVSGFNTGCFASWYANPSLSTLTANCSNLKVGIGTYYPVFDFEVFKATGLNETVKMKCQTGVAKNAEIWTVNTLNSFGIATDQYGKGHIYKNISSPTSIITFDDDGRVGIGAITLPTSWSSSVNYKLYVEDGIATRDVKVTAGGWPDYVFAKDYKQPTIYELEKYITVNKHLPDMPSANEIEKNKGFEVGDMTQKLLKKVEEQTLYIIELKKEIDELRQVITKK